MNSPQHKFVPLALLVLLGGVSQTFSQGTFQNLNFESARVIRDPSSPYFPNAIAATNALPGWTVSGSVTAPDVFYNDVSTGAAAVSLFDTNYVEPILQGNFSVFLNGYTGNGPGTASISQTGQIPVGSQSLTFEGAQIFGLQLSFDGQSLAYTPIGSGPNYTEYGANISSYAGDIGQLVFSTPPQSGGIIDNIQFINQQVPEPGTWAILLGGAATLFATSRWKRRT